MNLAETKQKYQEFVDSTGIAAEHAILILGASLVVRGHKRKTMNMDIITPSVYWLNVKDLVSSGVIAGKIYDKNGSKGWHQSIVLDSGVKVFPDDKADMEGSFDIVDGVAVESLQTTRNRLLAIGHPKDVDLLIYLDHLLIQPPLKLPRVHSAIRIVLREEEGLEESLTARKLGWLAGDRGLIQKEDIILLTSTDKPHDEIERIATLLLDKRYDNHPNLPALRNEAMEEFCTGAYCALDATRFEKFLV